MNSPVSIVLATESDVAVEERYFHLNKLGFVRAENALEQWYLLVNEAWKTSGIPENDLLMSYLVTMLNRFANNTDLFETLSVFDYCQNMLGVRKIDSRCSQVLADVCLQFVSFFPEQNARRHDSRPLEFIAEMGVSLYQQLAKESENKDDCFSEAYREMANSFGVAVMVLRSACPDFVRRVTILRESRALDSARIIPTDYEASQYKRATSLFELMFGNDTTAGSKSIN